MGRFEEHGWENQEYSSECFKFKMYNMHFGEMVSGLQPSESNIQQKNTGNRDLGASVL